MAIVRKVSINEKELVQRLTVEIKRVDGNPINREVDRQLTQITDDLIGVGDDSVAALVKRGALQGLTAGLNEISGSLSAGFPGAKQGLPERGWHPLSLDWIRHKKRASRDLFWRNTGDLSGHFNTEVQKYLLAVYTHHPVVERRFKRNTFGRKSMAYEIRLKLPPMPNDFMTKIIRDSFVYAAPYVGAGSHTNNNAFRKIGLLEGTGKTHRPFIAKVMARHGLLYQSTLVNKAITKAASRSKVFKV